MTENVQRKIILALQPVYIFVAQVKVTSAYKTWFNFQTENHLRHARCIKVIAHNVRLKQINVLLNRSA